MTDPQAKRQHAPDVKTLTQEVRSLGSLDLTQFLRSSARDIREVYRSGRCWTGLLRRSGLLAQSDSLGEQQLGRRMRALIHVDDERRAAAYTRLVSPGAPGFDELPSADQAFARMLFFALWRDGGDFATYQQGLDLLRGHSALCEEIRQVVAHGATRQPHRITPLAGELAGIALAVNARYTQEEILAALGYVRLGGLTPSTFREGVAWARATGCDALLVTLNKSEAEFGPKTMYQDHALTPELFHWETQHRTGASSSTGQRYQRHEAQGSHVLLFTRERKQDMTGGPEPYVLHGPVRYVSHVAERPMAITWRLQYPMPGELFRRAAVGHGVDDAEVAAHGGGDRDLDGHPTPG